MNQLMEIVFSTCIWILDYTSNIKSEVLSEGLDLFLMFFKDSKIMVKEEVSVFVSNINLLAFWKLVFLTLKIKNDNLKEKIH